MKILLSGLMALAIIFSSVGCGHTYLKENLTEAVIAICDKEYGIKVDAEIVGETLAIYLPLPKLFDANLRSNEKAREKIGDVLLSVTRVVLSTDATIKFYCVIVQDVRFPVVQSVIIEYVEDIRRYFYKAISRSDYFKRVVQYTVENPQYVKEEAVKEVFAKMGLESDMQEKVLEDFFRSPPNSLEGIGYWNGKFYIKDITLSEFLAQQMVDRILTDFRETEEFKKYSVKSVEGAFVSDPESKFFIVTFNAESLLFVFDPATKKSMQDNIFGNVFKNVSDVINSYKYEDFDLVKIKNINKNGELLIPKESIHLFGANKIDLSAILGALN